MALASRNSPCPCGSGRKYKRCCGYDRIAERALEGRLAAIEELARLAFQSPRLLPESDAYDAWVRATLAGETEPDTEAAIVTLGLEEPVRIVEACFELFPDAWSVLAPACGSERDAVGALLGGSVAAGIRDFRPVERWLIETIESSEEPLGDPVEALATCLDGEQLWSDEDGLAADAAVGAIPEWLDDDAYDERFHATLAALADELATGWHARRLERLVRRVEARLPFPGFPAASAAVADGCRRFGGDDRARNRLAAVLLSDMAGRATVASFRSRLAA